MDICGLQGSAKAFAASLLFKHTNKTILFITPSAKDAVDASRDLSFFLGGEDVLLFPPWDIIPPDDTLSRQMEIAVGRAGVLSSLLSGRSALIVASLSALIQRVAPRRIFESSMETMSIGDMRDRDLLAHTLREGGYERVPLVEKEGEFSLRGYIVDIFPPAYSFPFRLEFVGDEIESIREFDPANQRSLREVVDFVLSPAGELILSGERKVLALRNLRVRLNELDISRTRRERLIDTIESGLLPVANPQFLPLFYGDPDSGDDGQGLDTLFEYLPEDTVIISESPAVMEQSVEEVLNGADRIIRKTEEERRFFLERNCFLASWEEISRRSSSFRFIYSDRLQAEAPIPFEVEQIRIETASAPHAGDDGILAPVVDRIRSWIGEGFQVHFLCVEETFPGWSISWMNTLSCVGRRTPFSSIMRMVTEDASSSERER